VPICWGQSTGVLENTVKTFANNWTGTGWIDSYGDAERIAVEPGQYMVSEVVYSGALTIILLQNEYGAGHTVTLKYRHGVEKDDCLAATWVVYSSPFKSLGYVQVRLESTQ
jgi:hypothetical protein